MGEGIAARWRLVFGLMCMALLAAVLAAPARAHPHVWVEARTIVRFGDTGITELRHAWTFDEAFSAFAVQGLDADGDGRLSTAELEPLARTNIESLHEFAFFTFLVVEGEEADATVFSPPTDYHLEWDGRRLTLHFTLPLARPLATGRRPVVFEVYDPDYFVEFAFAAQDSAALAAAPAGCALRVHRPRALDDTARARLAEVPAERRELPPDLGALTEGLSNGIEVACR